MNIDCFLNINVASLLSRKVLAQAAAPQEAGKS